MMKLFADQSEVDAFVAGCSIEIVHCIGFLVQFNWYFIHAIHLKILQIEYFWIDSSMQ